MLSASLQPTPLSYFESLVEQDNSLPLCEAAAALAHIEHPDADIQSVLDAMDTHIARIKRRVPADASALDRLRLLTHYFYSEQGFGPALNDFYDAANSDLAHVLQTRRGIPISIAVIWIELAQSLGLNARGVSFPGHFLVKVTLTRGQVVIDPLSGASLSREELMERLEPFRRKSGLVGDYEMPLGLYLQAASGRDILLRMCRNLKEIYSAKGDHERLVETLHRALILQPNAHADRRDRGYALAELGHTKAALSDLQAYLREAEDALDVDAVAEVVAQLRKAGV
jgi:regulator of sirC expression with transglutaminase-like and TPR domain